MFDVSNSLPLMYGAGMSPEQQQQMMRNMYAMSLMRGSQGATTPQASSMGALGQGASPIMNALMYRSLMNQGQAPPPTGPAASAAAYSTTPANAATMASQLQYAPGGAGFTPNVNFGGAAPSSPGLFERIGNWFSGS